MDAGPLVMDRRRRRYEGDTRTPNANTPADGKLDSGSGLQGQLDVGSESPACLKLLTWLRMVGIEHDAVPLRGAPKSQTGKAP